ncbi:hypothetical protein Misp01_04630 [Microtetraspora sp. NBRC 13810]|uniref:DUF4129 domain-containing protein n=1 Tax=Microtetraspora sp. NBRC 13810 TaxID=3030990 RepID=UPI0024A22ABE|nr:DUF4129 domain-containing protein [Microtetraspora sp. NBRC 13810]GLW05333.1 hypothetical protein Misp01_04630 [Microtetraspora sp. NBRC 13810]
MSPIDIGRGEAQSRAAHELFTGGYAQEPLPDRILRIIQQFLGDLLEGRSGGLSGGMGALIVILVVVALAGLLLWQAKRATRGGGAAAGGLFGDRPLSAAEHRAESVRLAGEGLFARAVRERLRAIARDLEERAIVEPQPGRTAGELAAEAGRALPAFAADLSRAARVFDDVTYGEVPATSQAYETLRDLDDRLRAARPALATRPGGTGAAG